MQRIERYGVIALVFLLVTILAVSLWGESKQELFAGDDEPEPAIVASAPASSLPVARTSPVANRGARDRSLPTSDASRAQDARPRDRSYSRNPNVLEPESGAHRGAALPTPDTAPDTAPGGDADEGTAGRPRGQRSDDHHQARAASAATDYAPADPLRSAQGQPQRASEPTRPERQAAASSGAGPLASCVVGRGETLSQISQRELGTYRRWREIAALNGDLDPAKLREGMVLKLPGRGAASGGVAHSEPARAPEAVAREAIAPARKSGSRTYKVQRGDVLSVIAQRELGSSKRWKEIAQLNPKIDPDRLLVGTELALPGDTRVAAKTPAAVASPLQVASAEPVSAGWSGTRGGGKVR